MHGGTFAIESRLHEPFGDGCGPLTRHEARLGAQRELEHRLAHIEQVFPGSKCRALGVWRAGRVDGELKLLLSWSVAQLHGARLERDELLQLAKLRVREEEQLRAPQQREHANALLAVHQARAA